MAQHLIRPPGAVEHRVEQGRVIGGPFEPLRGLANLAGKQLSGLQILDRHREDFVAGVIDRVRQQLVIGTRSERTDLEVLLALGQKVAVEKNFLRRVKRAVLAAVNAILLAFFGAGVVKVFVALHRHGQIGLLDVRQHFRVEARLQILGMPQHGPRVGVLGFQIRDRIRIFAVPQPEIIVRASVPVNGRLRRHNFRDRWLGGGFGRGEGRWHMGEIRGRESVGWPRSLF